MWRAYFRDGFVIDERGENGYERDFSHVLVRHDILEKLSIHLDNGDVFTIDITKGLFSMNKQGQEGINFFGLPQDRCAQETLSNVRIIYFVRECITFNPAHVNQRLSAQTQFTALGFQANLCGGKNIKRYLAIYPDSTFDIRGEND